MIRISINGLGRIGRPSFLNEMTGLSDYKNLGVSNDKNSN